jgi:hypothetical protein
VQNAASPVERPWTNSSVLIFANGRDPLAAAATAARDLLKAAQDAGMDAPPVDVVELAKLLGLSLQPANTVADAAIAPSSVNIGPAVLQHLIPTDVPLGIAYNPSQPRGRLRFSIAHEIAHALFPDVAEVARHRTPLGALPQTDDDAWELELLCNVIAAELLIPDDAVAGLLNIDTDVDFIMETRRRWDVSTEALLRRLVTSSKRDLSMIAASRAGDSPGSPLRIDYATGSLAGQLHRGQSLPGIDGSSGPYAVGQTVKAAAEIGGAVWSVQAVGAPPFPGRSLPRALVLLEPAGRGTSDPRISYVTGDITTLDDGVESVLVGHVVSDSARAWSRRGVAAALARKFPQAAAAFRMWSIASPDNLRLGNVHSVELTINSRSVIIASMVAQQGYGPGTTTRLQYDALRQCLTEISALARRHGADVHLPRIGAGQAGGRWDLIEADISGQLVDNGVAVTIHTLPGRASGRLV